MKVGSDDLDDMESSEGEDMDIVELKLEKAVFGDEAGFHERLKEHGLSEKHPKRQGDDTLKQVEDQAEDDIRDIEDADLFILDSGPSGSPHHPASSRQDREASSDASEAAWHDSDDERIAVSLACNPRLRKLRDFEGEDLIGGREYTKRLRRQYERLCPAPEWAKPADPKKIRSTNGGDRYRVSQDLSQASGSEREMSVDSEDMSAPPLARLLKQPGAFLQPNQVTPRGKKKLRPEVIDIQRAKDVGTAQPSAITSLDFHPHHPLLLSSGPASTIFLHHISPRPPNPNPLLTSLHIQFTPLTTSSFRPPSGSKVLFAGRRRYFHSWDLSTGKIEKVSRVYGHQNDQKTMEHFKMSPCGRWMGLVGSSKKGGGLLNVLDAHTNQWIAEVRMESKGGVADFEWWGDGEGITALGKAGEAVEWDTRQKRIVGRWTDEGAVGTTVVATGGRGSGAKDVGGHRWVAVGSSSGIVNIYDRKSWGGKIPASPQPTRVFDQLTTPISHLVFSQDGQLMIMASRWKRDALRLVHLPSCTVYKNWPTSSTPLGRITAVAFAPASEMFAIANEQGKIRLWEVRG